jgi:hypothetical protein
MKNLKFLALGLGLSFLALHADRGTAATTCEKDCWDGYRQCQVVCSKNPCLISCEDQVQYCLNGCGSES